ncbi:MAG: RodZ domain-containing protein [Nitrospinota bacterium]
MIGDEGRDEGLFFEERASKGDKELGAYLREGRLSRGVSLEAMADTTRIKLRYLEAIEEGDFGKLPADPIIKGFLRAYARHIGIDDDAVVERYIKLHGEPSIDVKSFGREVLEREEEGGGRLKVLLVIVSLFVVGAIFYFFQSQSSREPLMVAKQEAPPPQEVRPAEEPPAEVRVPVLKGPSLPESKGDEKSEAAAGRGVSDRKRAPSAAQPSRPQKSPSLKRASPAKPSPPERAKPAVSPPAEEAPPQKPSTPPKPVETASARAAPSEKPPSLPEPSERAAPQGVPSEKPSPSPEPLESVPTQETPLEKPSPPEGVMVLAVKAIEDTWLRVVVDESSQYEVLLSAGNSREWQAKEKFVMTIGNVAGTRVSLNGQEVDLPPTSTNVIHNFTITKRPQS